ncbi:MAG: cell division protein FtsN [Flavobacteriales bacterium]|jgi:cell division protein FtsN
MPRPQNKKKHAQASRPGTERTIPGWLWLLTGCILGGFIMFIIRLADMKDSDPSVKNTTQKPTPIVQIKPEKQQPVFEFYERLKNATVEVSPDTTIQNKKNLDPKLDHYLQVASFRASKDANQLRAKLILLNLNAFIEVVEGDSGAWNRVMVGPFSSKSTRNKTRAILIDNGHTTAFPKSRKKPHP